MITVFGWERVFSFVKYPEWRTLTRASRVPHHAAGVLHLPAVPILDSLHDVFHLQTVGISDFHMIAAPYLLPPAAALYFHHDDVHQLLSPTSCNSS